MSGHIRAILAAIALLTATSTAQTTVLSDNLGQFSFFSEYATMTEWLAAGFATDAHVYDLTEVELKGEKLGGTGPVAVEVWTSTGVGLGEPGTFVRELMPISDDTFTANGITLAPSTHYWIVVRSKSPTTVYKWRWTPDDTGAGVGFTHTWGRSLDSGGNWDIFDSAPVQMKVTAEQVTAWTDLGQALAGVWGEPVLQGSGSLYPDTAADLLLTIAKPGAAAFFVLSSTAANLRSRVAPSCRRGRHRSRRTSMSRAK
jgi:hypothetical protein